MYLVGSDHPLKERTITALKELSGKGESLVSNTEVLQEILHRYTAIRRKDYIQLAFDALYALVDRIELVTEEDVTTAKDLVLSYEGLSARDALHAAQMRRLKISTLLSFDRGFEILPGVRRIPVD